MVDVLIKAATFVRPDTTASPNPGSVGDGWVDVTGSVWRIFSHTLTTQDPFTTIGGGHAAGNLIRPVDESFRNGKIRITPSPASGPSATFLFVLRYQDDDNTYWAFQYSEQQMAIGKRVAGANTTLASLNGLVFPDNDAWYIEFRMNETSLSLNLYATDGTLLQTVTADDGELDAAGQWGTEAYNDPRILEIAGYTEDITTITPVAGSIGFIGDSITEGYGVDPGSGPGPEEVAKLNEDKISGPTYSFTVDGVSGSTSADWVADSGNYDGALVLFISAGCGIVSIMLGTNDAKTAVATTKADYKANLLSLINALISAGATAIILNKPPWVSPTGAFDNNSLTLIGEYGDALAELAAADPSHVYMGDTAAYPFFEANPDLLADGVHPTLEGYTDLGNFWAAAYETNFPDNFPQPPVITSADTASGMEGVSFTPYQITATNSPTSFGATGLPTGLSVNTGTGLITGTPTQHGTFNATISATNADGTGTGPLTITIAAATFTAGTISRSSQTPTTVDLVASNSVGGTTPYTYQWYRSQVNGFTPGPSTLLTGETSLSLHDTGLTPEATYYYVMRYTDAGSQHVNSAQFTQVQPSNTYSQRIVTKGGVEPLAFAVTSGSLPPGIALNPITGLLLGLPSAAGTYYFQVTVTDGRGSQAAMNYKLVIT